MIVGITGSFGAGKGAVVEYLVASRGFKHLSVSGFITEEVQRRGLPVDRDSMTIVANDLRLEHGASFFIDSLYTKALKKGGNVVIESLRAIAEVRRLKELGGVVFGVDARPEVRYERAFLRGSEKDKVDFGKWLEQEKAEMNPEDPTKQDIFGSLKESSRVIDNNGSLEDLHHAVDAVLADVS